MAGRMCRAKVRLVPRYGEGQKMICDRTKKSKPTSGLATHARSKRRQHGDATFGALYRYSMLKPDRFVRPFRLVRVREVQARRRPCRNARPAQSRTSISTRLDIGVLVRPTYKATICMNAMSKFLGHRPVPGACNVSWERGSVHARQTRSEGGLLLQTAFPRLSWIPISSPM